ncbi:MAG: DPP IV N-terminal domain-containing protein, partial [Candidatus Korobacteraceae bacterium]
MRKLALTAGLLLLMMATANAQDWIRTGTGLGIEKVRLAVPGFAPSSGEGQTVELLKTFDDTLWNDLHQAGIFEVVSKSFYPLGTVGKPADIKLEAWGNPPPNAGMVAFGNLGVNSGRVLVQGWLFDTRNPQSPQVLGKQYNEAASVQNARVVAHRFANEIILRLGGGVPGIAETRIYFVSTRSGAKEIWTMDYDGANQHQLTHLRTIALSPRLSPDGSRVAFSAVWRGNWNVLMYSNELNRLVSFPSFGDAKTPAWSGDGTRLAFSSSRTGDPEIYSCDANGGNLKRLTAVKGPDVSPVWNPRTGAQIAFVSGRSGYAQIYMMDSDGANVQRLTDGGYAVSPSWSPNGQFLVLAWMRRYGPGAPGAQDIYIMDIASRQWVQ